MDTELQQADQAVQARLGHDTWNLKNGKHPITNKKWEATEDHMIDAGRLIGVSPDNFCKIMNFTKPISPIQHIANAQKEGYDVTLSPDQWNQAMTEAQYVYGLCYERLVEEIEKYLDMPVVYRKVIALWIIGTYLHSSFNSYPYLYFNAMRGSGKSRILEFISHVAYQANGKKQTGITESVLFRTKEGATLVLDEMESISSKDKAILREYLNSSYKRGATVERMRKVKKADGENFEVQTFKTYRPIVMANIFGMNEILGDRCLTLVLDKSASARQTKKMEDFSNNNNISEIKSSLNRFNVVLCHVVVSGEYIKCWNDYIEERYRTINNITSYIPFHTITPLNDSNNKNNNNLALGMSYDEKQELFRFLDESGANGRNLELIFSLILTARMIGKPLCEEMLPLLMNLISKKKEEEYADDKDVSFIEFVSLQDRYQYISMNELARKFREYLGEMEDEDRWLNAKWIGHALKRLNLIGIKRRVTRGREVLLAVDVAKEKLLLFKDKPEVTP